MNLKSTYVPASGNPSTAKYILVGEQPGITEIRRGSPFVGPSGQELDSFLHSAGISRADCYITNVIKDADKSLDHYIKSTSKGYIIQPEGQEYIDLLITELSSCTAKVIISLGNIPLFALSGRNGITKWRGSVLKPTLFEKDKLLIPTIHPANTLPDKGGYKNKRLIILDLKKARKIQEKGWYPLNRQILIRPTFSQCLQFLTVCEQYGLLGNVIFYDIEVDIFTREMTCISFAYSSTDAISIPFTYEKGDYFTIPQESELLLYIAKILENPDIPIGGQNLTFDSHYLLHKYGIKVTNIHDTMIAQKTLLSDYPVALHFICSLYTDLPYYKEDGKYWLKGIGTFEKGWNYNALDSIVCAEALVKQEADLMKQHNYYAYLRKCKVVEPLTYMMEHGIKINLGSMTQAYNDIGIELTQVLKNLHEKCGYDINPNSPKQVKEYFYIKKGLKPYKSKTGGDSTDEKTLKRIARKGFPEASLILKLRGLNKERSTFLDPTKVDPDGRMRCSYNPVGTRFSRLSSSENIFGTGNNLQNQPHRVLSHFLADSNYVFYGMDLSQAENRIVAYVGKISQMIEAFEKGEDIHGLTARIMMNIFYTPEKTNSILKNCRLKDGKQVWPLAPIGSGKQTWRDWGKKANHGLNYDLGYVTFSLYNEITERDGKIIVDIYHRAYPGVRGGYHSYVKQCINKDRTITNLMGRKTLFTDRLDDGLYKDAYACIPQGTVGDVVDLRGVNFIYYNTSPLFTYVELLVQVHDQIGFQIPTPYHPTTPISWSDHSNILKEIKKSLETPLHTHYGLSFVIPVDTHMGVTLNKDDGKELKSLDPLILESTYKEVTKRWLPVIDVKD